eukprot:jgi/Orpsp1_1/1189888/evm.model.d7180000075233.1
MKVIYTNINYEYAINYPNNQISTFESISKFKNNKLEINFFFPSDLSTFKNEFLNNFKTNSIFHNCSYNNFDSQKYQCSIRINEYNNVKDVYTNCKNNNLFDIYGVIFKSKSEYILHFPYKFNCYSKINIDKHSTIQYIIDQTIISTIAPASQEIKVKYKMMDNDKNYSISHHNSALKKVPLFMVLYFICYSVNLFSYLVHDKETKILSRYNETNEFILWTSWVFIYGPMVLINSIIASYFLSFSTIFMNISCFVLFIIFFIFGISCCGISFLLSTIVNSSRVSFTVSKYLVLCFLAFYYLFINLKQKNRSNIIINFCSYLFSPFSFINFIYNFMDTEIQEISVTFQNIFEINILCRSFIRLIISSILVIVVAIYIENNITTSSLAKIHENQDNKSIVDNTLRENEEKEKHEKNKNDPLFIYGINILSNNTSNISQILTVMKIKIKSYLNNEKIFVLNILLPICLCAILMNYTSKIISSNLNKNYQKFQLVEINSNLYSNEYWFKDITSSNSTLNIINEIEKNTALKSVNYSKESSFDVSETIDYDINSIYIGGFKGIFYEDTKLLEMILYYNATYEFSLPIAINIIDNAILHSKNIEMNIIVHYLPLGNDITQDDVYIEENDDKDHWINTNFFIFNDNKNTLLIVEISIILSYSISCFGPLMVKDRKEGIPQ